MQVETLERSEVPTEVSSVQSWSGRGRSYSCWCAGGRLAASPIRAAGRDRLECAVHRFRRLRQRLRL